MRDPHFFLHTFAPQTAHMSFIDMSIDAFTQPYFDWKIGINKMWELPWDVEKEFVTGTLPKKLESLLPLSKGGDDRNLILETKSNWLVYYSNGFNGGDVSGPTRHMLKALKGRMITVMYQEDEPIGKVGSLQFIYQDWRGVKPIVRSVAAHHEGHWQFIENGERLHFEEIQGYTAKKIKDRLTIDMVERYLRHFGIKWFDPDFYEGKAYLIRGYPLPNAAYYDEFPNQQMQAE